MSWYHKVGRWGWWWSGANGAGFLHSCELPEDSIFEVSPKVWVEFVDETHRNLKATNSGFLRDLRSLEYEFPLQVGALLSFRISKSQSESNWWYQDVLQNGFSHPNMEHLKQTVLEKGITRISQIEILTQWWQPQLPPYTYHSRDLQELEQSSEFMLLEKVVKKLAVTWLRFKYLGWRWRCPYIAVVHQFGERGRFLRKGEKIIMMKLQGVKICLNISRLIFFGG